MTDYTDKNPVNASGKWASGNTPLPQPPKVTRFEVIDVNAGRLIVRYGVDVELSYQDDGRTLKVFMKDAEQ